MSSVIFFTRVTRCFKKSSASVSSHLFSSMSKELTKSPNVGLMPLAYPRNSSKLSGQILLHNRSSDWSKQTGNKDLAGTSNESK